MKYNFFLEFFYLLKKRCLIFLLVEVLYVKYILYFNKFYWYIDGIFEIEVFS